MADRKLQILITARDKVSNTLGKMGGAFDKLSGGLKSLAAVGGAAIVGLTASVGALGFKLLSLGSDAAEMQSKFNIVFGDSAAFAIRQLDEFAEAAGRSSFELQGMASTFQDTLVPMGLAEDEAAELSIQMTKLATDLSSFNNIPMDEALQRLQGTLIGSHENALAFGVVINENTLKAELAKQGWDELTGAQLEAAKVQARINLLMEGTASAQGDAIRTGAGWANQIRALQSAAADAATAIGLELLPTFEPLLQNLTQMVRDLLPRAVQLFEDFSAELNANMGPAVLQISDALSRIGVSLGIVDEKVTAADASLSSLEAILNGILAVVDFVANDFQNLAAYIEATRAEVEFIIEWWNNLSTAFNDAIQIAADLRAQLALIFDLGGAPAIFQAIWEGISAEIQTVIGLITNFNETLGSLSLPDWLTPGSPTPLETGLLGISEAMNKVSGTSQNLNANLPGGNGASGVDGGQAAASLAQLEQAARSLTETLIEMNTVNSRRSASAESSMGAPSRI